MNRLKIEILKILRSARKSDGYVSGESISEKLKVTRAAVWKAIEGLKELGYKIQSHKRLGYKLVEDEILYNQIDLEINLSHKYEWIKKVYFYDEVDSTQKVAKDIVKRELKGWTIVVADSQKHGRGRLSRSWFSPKGKGIWVSVILKPKLPPSYIQLLSLVSGIAVCKAIKEVCDMDAGLKWPNDVLLNGKKLCGIIAETASDIDEIKYAIIGLGLNVSTRKEEFPKEIRPIATSLFIEGSKTLNRVFILQKLVENLKHYLDILESPEGHKKLIRLYKKYNITIGKKISFIYHKSQLTGYAVDIDALGNLLVDTKDSGVLRLAATDIFHVRDANALDSS